MIEGRQHCSCYSKRSSYRSIRGICRNSPWPTNLSEFHHSPAEAADAAEAAEAAEAVGHLVVVGRRNAIAHDNVVLNKSMTELSSPRQNFSKIAASSVTRNEVGDFEKLNCICWRGKTVCHAMRR